MNDLLLVAILSVPLLAFVAWRLRATGLGIRWRVGMALALFGNEVGAFIADVIRPPDLIGYVRERAVLQPPTLETIMPKRTVDDLEFTLQNYESPFVNIARFRGWGTPPPMGKRAGIAQITGEIMPLGLSLTRNEKEVARLTQLLNNLPAGARGPREIYDDAVNCGLAAEVRIEIARADVLTDGVLTLNENGAIVTADFGVPGTHLVTAATAWTDTTNAVPVDNLLAWEAVYRADNGGRNPDAWLISSAVLGNLQRNAQVKSLANEGGGVPGIVPADRIADVMRISGVRAPLVVFDGQVPDTSGVATPTLNARHVVGVRDGVGEVLVGTHPMAQLAQLAGKIQPSIAPGLFTWVDEESRPVRVTTTTEAVALPVLRDPKALFRAVV